MGIAAFSIAKRRIDDITDGALKGSLGNALWLGLAAAVRAGPAHVFSRLLIRTCSIVTDTSDFHDLLDMLRDVWPVPKTRR